MFVSDKVVFVELHKTGCTHIRHLLKELVGGEFVGKHNQIGSGLLAGDRLLLGSIRDPWSWYVSLWAYGCDHKGFIYGNATRDGVRLKGHGWKEHPLRAVRSLLAHRANRHAAQWRRTYENVNDPGAFRAWLHMLHDERYWHDYGEGYGRSRASRVAGLYSYRYMKLFTCRDDGDEVEDGIDGIDSHDELVRHEQTHCFIDHFIRNERLEHDLFQALESSGIHVPERTRLEILARPKTNTSSRSGGADFYYDDASERLVGERDRLIVDRFSYRPPSLRRRPGLGAGSARPVQQQQA